MGELFRDVRLAARQLVRERGFLATVVATLALCVGANATIFALVSSVVLRPLPFDESERLVAVWNAYPGAGIGAELRGTNSAADYFDRRSLTDVFAEVASFATEGRTLEIEGVPQRVRGLTTTPSLFPLLRVRAALGRTFTEEELEPGNDRVVVLGDSLWRQLYGGASSAIGTSLRIDGRSYTVVGVLPAGFVFLDPEVRLFTPLAFPPDQRQAYHQLRYGMVARLAPGATLEGARQRLDALNARNLEALPDLAPFLRDAGFHTAIRRLQDDLVRDVRSRLYLLWAGVALVLLIGCVNVANLVLVRATGRAREVATRFALGASRSRVLGQLFTEVALLALAGSLLGLVLGWAGLCGLAVAGLADLPRGEEIGLDATVVLFTVGLAAVVSGLVSIVPVASVSRVRLTAVIREEGRGGTAGRGLGLLRRGLVTAQVALALVLLVTSGLLIESFREVLRVDPGFPVDRVLTGGVVLSEERYPETADLRGFGERALERIRAVPGVQAAGLSDTVPFGAGFGDTVIFAEGYALAPGESVVLRTRIAASPGLLEALGIPILEGRAFDEGDDLEAPPVIVVDELLARRFWNDGTALGKRVWNPNSSEQFSNPRTAPHLDVIGVAKSVHVRGLTSERDALGTYYFPLSQSTRRSLYVIVRATGEPKALVEPVRRALAEIDPGLAFFDVGTIRERIDASLAERRAPMVLTTTFGLAALLLAALGIYGMLSYLVQLRTREIGIRVALGSDRRAVFGLVLRDGLLVVASGLGLGLVGAWGAGRFVKSQLYGVSVHDPSVVALVVAVLAAVALVACVIPARRATRLDPIEALTD